MSTYKYQRVTPIGKHILVPVGLDDSDAGVLVEAYNTPGYTMPNWLYNALRNLDENITFNWGGLRVRNAINHPDAINAGFEGGNIAGRVTGSMMAFPEVAYELASAGLGEAGSYLTKKAVQQGLRNIGGGLTSGGGQLLMMTSTGQIVPVGEAMGAVGTAVSLALPYATLLGLLGTGLYGMNLYKNRYNDAMPLSYYDSAEAASNDSTGLAVQQNDTTAVANPPVNPNPDNKPNNKPDNKPNNTPDPDKNPGFMRRFWDKTWNNPSKFKRYVSRGLIGGEMAGTTLNGIHAGLNFIGKLRSKFEEDREYDPIPWDWMKYPHPIFYGIPRGIYELGGLTSTLKVDKEASDSTTVVDKKENTPVETISTVPEKDWNPNDSTLYNNSLLNINTNNFGRIF